MIDKYSLKYKIANLLANFLLKERRDYFFSQKKRADILIKLIMIYEGKVLIGKKIQENCLSKMCLPDGYLDLNKHCDNISTCIQIAFDDLNIELELEDFNQKSLIDLRLEHSEHNSAVVYVYKYNMHKQDLDKVSDSFSMYDFFLLDLQDLDAYNKKKRFVSNLDYKILSNYKRTITGER